MLVRQLLGAQRAHDEQASLRIEAQQIVYPCQGLPVAPLQVVEQQQERAVGAQQSTRQGFKQALTPSCLPVLLQWTWRRQARPFLQQIRQEPCHFAEPDRI